MSCWGFLSITNSPVAASSWARASASARPITRAKVAPCYPYNNKRFPAWSAEAYRRFTGGHSWSQYGTRGPTAAGRGSAVAGSRRGWTTHLLSNHYNQTRAEYCRQLKAASDSGGDVIPFIEYAVTGFVEGLREQLKIIRYQQWDMVWRNYVHE